MEILFIMGIIVCALWLFLICVKLKKEYNELVDEYNLLVDENTQIRKEIEKVKGENQDLIQIILKYYEK